MTEELDEYMRSQAFRARPLQFPRKDVVTRAIELIESGERGMCCMALKQAVYEIVKPIVPKTQQICANYAVLFKDHCWITDGLVQHPHWWNDVTFTPTIQQLRIAALKSFLETCHD